MSENKSCIYEIYEWMGVVGKYSGCFPLPGLYEKREWSKWTKGLINYVIPAINFAFLLLVFVMLCLNYEFKKTEDLTEILLVIIFCCVFVQFLDCIVFNHFSLRKNLVGYLKLHLSVNELLKPSTYKLKSFVRIFVVVFTTLLALNIGIFTNGDYMESLYQRYCENPTIALMEGSIRLLVSYILSIAVYTHPHFMYIIFQRTLKSSFDELREKIKENKNLSGKMQVQQIRKYMRLYGDLCKISARLDHMVSPLMLNILIGYYINEIHSLTYFVSTFNMFSLADAASIVSGSVPLIFVPDVAYRTKKAHDEILPAIYSTFNSNDEAVKTELQTFALQLMYFNQPFSASGFVKLDRKLIVTIVQSLISQVVVFYKIHKEFNKTKT